MKLKNNQQFIIYGAGNRGRWCLGFFEWKNMKQNIWGFCDKRYDEIKQIKEKVVVSYEQAKRANLPFLVSCADEQTGKDILYMIKNDGYEAYLFDDFYKILDEDQTQFLRELCAYHHAKTNNQWFSDAENKETIDVFWNENSTFYKYFKELDLQNVIELACGWGRHVPFYLNLAKKITLVDILEENIDICKERFKEEKITFYKNNGYNFEKLLSNEYSSIFSYDSVVHFEMMDVYSYLIDMNRVLKKGGRALIHHSNYAVNYKVDFAHSPHARCFMSKEIFAYLAYRAGFKIVSQEIIDWYDMKDLDCITLLEK